MFENVSVASAAGNLPVILLVHNEANLLPAFLAHYRGLCAPHFVVLDDRSTDGTAEMLRAQPDVTLYRPQEGSTFAEHRNSWRAMLLDRHAAERWAVVPDADELLVFPRMEERPLAAYLDRLDHEGAQGVLTVMVDMYADRPLGAHRFQPSDGTLLDSFPFFDGPCRAPFGYHLRYGRKLARRMPTPLLSVHGGMRDRLFRLQGRRISRPALAVLDRLCGLDGPVTPSAARLAALRLARPLLRPFFHGALDMHKIGIIRWREGLRYGSAHRLHDRLHLSESIAAFLHFKFTWGVEGLEYNVNRGQHADAAGLYSAILQQADLLARSPVYPGSCRYAGSASLSGIIRDIPARS